MRPEIAWQPSLFDDGAPAHDFSRTTRHVLDERSWVDHCPGWLAGADTVLAELASLARWDQRTVTMFDRTGPEPRLTAGWSTDLLDDPPPAAVLAMAAAVGPRYGVVLDRIWVNLYRDGRDSVAWHGDRTRFLMTEPLVATVSLGARRRFLLRRRGTTSAALTLEPGPGDLVVMGGACQAEWEHTVPKTTRPVGARMSVTMRHSVPAAGQRMLARARAEQPGFLV